MSGNRAICLLADSTFMGGLESMVWRLGLVLVAALVGALLVSVGLKFGYRAAGMNEVHRPVKVVGRAGGALVAGVLMFLWCFSGGSGGWLGGGGGFWPFGAGGGGSATTKGDDKGKEKTKDTTTPKKVEDGPELLVVHMLGGTRVKEQRFYVVDGETALGFEDLKARIRREQAKNRNLKKVEIRVYQDSVDPDNPAVAQLKKWVAAQDLTPAVATPPGNAP